MVLANLKGTGNDTLFVAAHQEPVRFNGPAARHRVDLEPRIRRWLVRRLAPAASKAGQRRRAVPGPAGCGVRAHGREPEAVAETRDVRFR